MLGEDPWETCVGLVQGEDGGDLVLSDGIIFTQEELLIGEADLPWVEGGEEGCISIFCTRAGLDGTTSLSISYEPAVPLVGEGVFLIKSPLGE